MDHLEKSMLAACRAEAVLSQSPSATPTVIFIQTTAPTLSHRERCDRLGYVSEMSLELMGGGMKNFTGPASERTGREGVL